MVKYNKKQRLGIAKVLRSAKRHLARDFDELSDPGKEEYICYALSNGWDTVAIHQARCLIEERIAPWVSFDIWLQYQPGMVGFDYRSETIRTRIQEHRHAWVDMLIKEFSK